jgi:hypothetical protein
VADFDKRGKSNELPVLILAWKENLRNYSRNEGLGESMRCNAEQPIELDANAFANAMLIKENYPTRILDGQEERMIKRIREICWKLWRLDIHIGI